MKKFFLTLFLVFASVFYFSTPVAKADTENIVCSNPNDPATCVICTDVNDPNTCYSDPNVDIKLLLQENEEAMSENPTEQEQQQAQKAMSFDIKQLARTLNPIDISGPEDIFGRAINALMAFIGSIALILYIFAGFIWMSAGGNAEKVTKAKSILVWTTLGVAAMGASYMIVRVVLENVG